MTFQLQTDKDPFEFHILSRASGDVTSGLFIRSGCALPFLFYLSECKQNRFVSGGPRCANSGLVCGEQYARGEQGEIASASSQEISIELSIAGLGIPESATSPIRAENL